MRAKAEHGRSLSGRKLLHSGNRGMGRLGDSGLARCKRWVKHIIDAAADSWRSSPLLPPTCRRCRQVVSR
jgi:hypothetical protein